MCLTSKLYYPNTTSRCVTVPENVSSRRRGITMYSPRDSNLDGAGSSRSLEITAPRYRCDRFISWEGVVATRGEANHLQLLPLSHPSATTKHLADPCNVDFKFDRRPTGSLLLLLLLERGSHRGRQPPPPASSCKN